MRPYYWFCCFLCQWFSVLYFRVRCHGQRHIPAKGPVLIVSNHQSFMDPIFAGIALPREPSFMARDTLFRNRVFGPLIASVNAFPVRRGEADIGAIKESLRRLKAGATLVLFPEGTRSPDGKIGPMLSGVGAIAKRARVPIVPTLVDGVFKTWPRHQLLPRPGDVIVEYGPAIMPEEFENMTPEELIKEIRDRLLEMQARLHRRMPERRLESNTSRC
jgi:1-acyl-sn-glycerol-3-phosphate acyltransferase